MSQSIKFSEQIKKIAGLELHKYRYEIITPWKGSGSVFFRKNLFNDICGFVQFSRSPLIIPLSDSTKSLRSFQVYLIRNKGEKPDTRLSNQEDKNTLLLPICYLLWDVLNIQKYKSRFYEWSYQDPTQLEAQINAVLDDLVLYGLPWIEDKNSRNPY